MVALAAGEHGGPDPHHADHRRPRHRHRSRREDPDVAAAQLAPRRAHRGADRRLRAAGGRAAEDGHLRLRPDPAARRARGDAHLRPLSRGLRRGRHHLRLPHLPRPSPGTGAKGDLKRLIAYSSVGHMGFVLLGIATLTPTGVNGALFANIAHGLITGLLFFLVGGLKERTGTTDLDTLSGETGGALYGSAPRFGGLLAFAAVASLGLPGLAGFWGEMLALLGAYDPAAGLSRPAFVTFMVLGGLGTLLTAAYLLVVVRRVCMGDRTREDAREPEHGAGTAERAAPRPARLRVRRLDAARVPHRRRRPVARPPPRAHRPRRAEPPARSDPMTALTHGRPVTSPGNPRRSQSVDWLAISPPTIAAVAGAGRPASPTCSCPSAASGCSAGCRPRRCCCGAAAAVPARPRRATFCLPGERAARAATPRTPSRSSSSSWCWARRS